MIFSAVSRSPSPKNTADGAASAKIIEISLADKRILIGIASAPLFTIAKKIVMNSQQFGRHIATRSPMPIPDLRNAVAIRPLSSCNWRKVTRVSPQTVANLSGKA